MSGIDLSAGIKEVIFFPEHTTAHMKLDPQSNILHLDTFEVPLKQISLQQGRLLLKFLWDFQTNVDLFLALYQNGFSICMPLLLL